MATKTALLTLGRLPKGLELVRALHAAGYRVLVAEPHRWHLCRVSNLVAKSFQVTAPQTDARAYLDELLRIVRDEHVELVVPVSEETMHAAGLKALLPPGVRMACPSQEMLIALHDKQRFIELAASVGMDVPRTLGLEVPGAPALVQSMKVVVKPRFSCSGRGVQFVERGQPLPSLNEPAVVQQFIEGDVLSTFSVAREGRVLGTSVYRGVVMSGTVSVVFERVPHPAIEAWVEAFVSRTAHDGFISFDFVVDATGRAFAIECNPRVTSGVHFVDSSSLARALVDGVGPLAFRANTLAQQFYPTLTETQKSVFSPRFKKNFKAMLAARDVVWSWSDPLPFTTMMFTAWQILSYAIIKGTSLGEASTYDLEWTPDPASLAAAAVVPEARVG